MSQAPTGPSRLRSPALRFGVGLRSEHLDDFLQRADAGDLGVDFLEIISENFFHLSGENRALLERLRGLVPIIPHGVGLSLGSPEPLDEEYLERLAALVEFLDPPWVSDHLCYSSAYGVQYHDLLPLPYQEEAIRRVVERLEQVQTRLGRPFLVENPTSYVDLPGAEMDEAGFISAVVRRAGCGLLLDINNVFVNARNRGTDPHAVIDGLPRGSVKQYHLAGHTARDGMLIDTHGAPIAGEVHALYAHAVHTLGPAWTLIERDQDIPPLPELLAEVDQLRLEALDAVSRVRDDPAEPRRSAAGSPRPPAVTEINSLDAVQRELHGVLRGEIPPEDTGSRWAVPVRGLRLYRNFIRRHVREMIEEVFPVLTSCLSDEARRCLHEGFTREKPLEKAVLAENAAGVPAYLEELSSTGRIRIAPWHLELAELELAVTGARLAPVVEPVAAGTLALNPTLELFQFQYPVADLLRRQAAPDTLEAEPGVTFVWRHPENHTVHAARAEDAWLMVLKLVHDGQSVLEVARDLGVEPAVVEGHLERARKLGFVIGSGAGETNQSP